MIIFSNLNETWQVYAISHELSLIQISTPGNIIFILFCPKTVSLIDQPGKKRSLLFSDKFLTDFETKTIFQWPNSPRLSSRNLTFKTCLASLSPRLAWRQWITRKATLIRTLRVLMMQWERFGAPHGGNIVISTVKTTSIFFDWLTISYLSCKMMTLLPWQQTVLSFEYLLSPISRIRGLVSTDTAPTSPLWSSGP